MSGGIRIQYKNTKGDYIKPSLVSQQLHTVAEVKMAFVGLCYGHTVDGSGSGVSPGSLGPLSFLLPLSHSPGID
jgi:hypothetical protein